MAHPLTVTPPDTEHALYRFFDQAGTLLYVGISIHPFARMGQHRHDKSWWGEVATVTIERHPDRASVLAAERDAIMSERPSYNIVHAGTRKRRPRVMYRFTYWEPAIGGLLTIPNVVPKHCRVTFLYCRCGRSFLADHFYELPTEMECRGKCDCGSYVSTYVDLISGPLLLWQGGR